MTNWEAFEAWRNDYGKHSDPCAWPAWKAATLLAGGVPELETVYEVIINWDENGGKRSRRELARRIVDLYAEWKHHEH